MRRCIRNAVFLRNPFYYKRKSERRRNICITGHFDLMVIRRCARNIMSMLYDPVTRQFRPRDLQANLPKRADGGSPTVTPSSAEVSSQRSRRWQSIRHRYHRREMAFWLLAIFVVAALIACTLFISHRFYPHTGSEKNFIDRMIRDMPDM